jgi:hypothetical protein
MAYWDQVRGRAAELLAASSLSEWTVNVCPRAAGPGQPELTADQWGYEADHASKRLDVRVQPVPHALDEESPEDVASLIILDLLHAAVGHTEEPTGSTGGDARSRMRSVLNRWRDCRRELDELRELADPDGPRVAARRAELEAEIEGLDAEIWMLGHHLGY